MFQFLVIVALLVPLASARGADRRAIRLEYTAPPSCPSKEAFQSRLAARLGYDAVSEPASHVAGVVVQVHEGQLEASFSLWEIGGLKRGERSFSGALTDCDALISGVALAMAIALDPRLLTRAPVEPPAATPPPPVAPPPVVTPSPVAVASSNPLHLSLAVGVRSSVGLLPTLSAGPSFEARLRLRSFSIAADGDVFLAPTFETAGGRVETSLVRGGVQLCGHVAFLALCARGTGGGLAAGGSGFQNNRRGWQGVATVGPLLSMVWRPVSGLVLQASLAMDVVLIRNAITLGSIELWGSPLVAGNAGLSVGWQFL